MYRQISSIERTTPQRLTLSRLGLQLSLPDPLRPGVKWKWRCSWSSAGRRFSNYIWVISNCIAYQGATYIRGLMAYNTCAFFLHIFFVYRPTAPVVCLNKIHLFLSYHIYSIIHIPWEIDSFWRQCSHFFAWTVNGTCTPDNLNIFRPGQNGCHFPDMLKRILVNKNMRISIGFHWTLFLRILLAKFQYWFK